MSMMKDPVSGLILPKHFIAEKTALTKSINDWVDKTVNEYQHIKGTYFLTFHAKFNPYNPGEFKVDAPKISKKLPPFISNSLVYYVSNSKGFKELLWMVAPKKPGEKLKVEFNKEGVAYLQAKSGMPS